MNMPSNMLDVFFQRMPMALALFDTDLVLYRCNPTWVSYIANHRQGPVVAGTPLYTLLPGTENTLRPYVERALAGEMVEVDAMRLVSSGTVSYWDVVFAPWVEGGQLRGLLQVATDVTEKVLSRQLLERRVRDRTRKLAALYEVMTVATELTDVPAVLQQSLDRVLAAVEAKGGAIQLLNEDAEALVLVAHQGLPANVVQRMQHMPADAGLAGWAASHDAPLSLADLTSDRRSNQVLRRSDLRAYVGVPMSSEAGVRGVLSVFRETRRPFTQEDIAVLSAVADQIATAIEIVRLRQENARLLVMEERNRLARELHDAVSQSLYSLTLFAETGKRLAQAGNLPAVVQSLARVGETAQQALREMRLLVHNLRPSLLEKAGLEKALRQRLDAVEKRAGISASLEVRGPLKLSPPVEEAMYHIAQEALNNSLKHASASQVQVLLQQRGHALSLTVSDNGDGFDPAHMDDHGGLGLTSMRERVERWQGEVEVRSARHAGTTIHVSLDLEAIEEAERAGGLFSLLARE